MRLISPPTLIASRYSVAQQPPHSARSAANLYRGVPTTPVAIAAVSQRFSLSSTTATDALV